VTDESHVWPVDLPERYTALLRDVVPRGELSPVWLDTSVFDRPRRPSAREREQHLADAAAAAARDLASVIVDHLLDGDLFVMCCARRGGRSLLRRQVVDELLTRLDAGDQALAENVPSGLLNDDEFAQQLARLVPAAAVARCRRDLRFWFNYRPVLREPHTTGE
jgi:hypothetical protein